MKGFRQKSNMTRAEKQKLVSAENEETRQKAMADWYTRSEVMIWDLYEKIGFPAHKTQDEKFGMITGTLMGLCAKILAADPTMDKDAIAEQAEAFLDMCLRERKLLDQQHDAERHTAMSAIVAGLILDPGAGAQEGAPALAELLVEPWLGASKVITAENREDREKAVFAYLSDEEHKDERSVCPAGTTATLVRGKINNLVQLSAEANRSGFLEGLKWLAAQKAKGSTDDSEQPAAEAGSSDAEAATEAEPSNVVSLVDPSGRPLREDLESVEEQIEEAVKEADRLLADNEPVPPAAS